MGEQTKPIVFSYETVGVDARTVRIVFSERAQMSVHAQKNLRRTVPLINERERKTLNR